VAMGADAFAVDDRRQNALHILAARGPGEGVRESLAVLLGLPASSAHAASLIARDADGNTPYVLAAMTANLPALEGLLAKASAKDKVDAGESTVPPPQCW
jgi:ankyrin repeat protein